MKSNNTHRFLGMYVQIFPHVMEEGGPRKFFVDMAKVWLKYFFWVEYQIGCSHPTPKTGETSIVSNPQATSFSFHYWDGLK